MVNRKIEFTQPETSMMKVVGYKIVVGFPATVETTVGQMLSDGWCLNGSLIPFLPDGQQRGLFLQGMIKVEHDAV